MFRWSEHVNSVVVFRLSEHVNSVVVFRWSEHVNSVVVFRWSEHVNSVVVFRWVLVLGWKRCPFCDALISKGVAWPMNHHDLLSSNGYTVEPPIRDPLR